MTPRTPEQSQLWPPTPGAAQELQVTWLRERLPTGHHLWGWSVGAWCAVCGPVALACGSAPPFAGTHTLGAATQRLVRAWMSDTTGVALEGQGPMTHTHHDLMRPFHSQMEMRNSLG